MRIYFTYYLMQMRNIFTNTLNKNVKKTFYIGKTDKNEFKGYSIKNKFIRENSLIFSKCMQMIS